MFITLFICLLYLSYIGNVASKGRMMMMNGEKRRKWRKHVVYSKAIAEMMTVRKIIMLVGTI